MKILEQFSILFAITFFAEVIKHLLPFPIPASIYGMLLLFSVLCLGWVKLGNIQKAGGFFIEIMPIMFIPAAVGLLVSFQQLEAMFIPAVITVIVTTFVVSAVTGIVTQWVIRYERRREK
ncbi:MAG: CidA/LrgA family protein [Selenomonadaceae bacterium]|jgi:Putative effector of murein hydrolase LrgA